MNTHLFHLNYFRIDNKKGFDPHPVIMELFQEFQTNWQNFINGLRGNYPSQFEQQINNKRKDFKQLTFYSGEGRPGRVRQLA